MSSINDSLLIDNLVAHPPEKCYYVWFITIIAASVVGLTGILPVVFLPYFVHKDKNNILQYSHKLRLMLSFAVGGLLGDVFLHLLPEAWNYVLKTDSSSHNTFLFLGFWVLCGLSTFVSIEMIFAMGSIQNKNKVRNTDEAKYKEKEQLELNGSYGVCYDTIKKQELLSGSLIKCNGETRVEEENNQVTGYLNLLANGIDNFSHGLAVAGSFLVGTKVGVLTTFAIIVHEIPHEFGDFAILMKSGFSKWQALKAQLSTASIGILGAVFALTAESNENLGIKTAWILPFTAGGFIHISMISILPDLLKEDNPWESLKQLLCITSGIAIMGLVNFLAD